MVSGGVAISSPHVKRYGTLCCLFADQDGVVYGLTAGHVLTNGFAREAIPVHQAHYRRDRRISHATKQVRRHSERDAIAFPLADDLIISAGVLTFNQIRGVSMPEVGQVLTKWGAGTGSTQARVRALDHGYIDIEPLEVGSTLAYAGGDSGSAWISESTSTLVGLHLGSDPIGFGKALRMDEILPLLDLTLLV